MRKVTVSILIIRGGRGRGSAQVHEQLRLARKSFSVFNVFDCRQKNNSIVGKREGWITVQI